MEGMLIAFVGATSGLLLGYVICALQKRFGFVSMGMETSLVDAYPVTMEAWDFVTTGITILLITFIISYRPALRASRVSIKDTL